MPVENSIHWKPLRDPHYVLASMQSGSEGFHSIFVEQAVLVRVQETTRATHGGAVGLLLGRRYVCSDTGSTYMLIDSLLEQTMVNRSEALLGVAVGELLAKRRADDAVAVLGWFCSYHSHEQGFPTPAASVHAALFPNPYQVALVLASDASSGGFFRHDRLGSRWYHTPFYEVTPATTSANQPKASAIAWPDYMTNTEVVRLPTRPSPIAEAGGTEGEPRPSLLRSLVTRSDARKGGAKGAARLSPKVVGLTTEAGADDVPARGRELLYEVPGAREPQSLVRPLVPESADTSAADSPERFIQIALLEGFFIAGKFETRVGNADETLWILNEPYSSFLLTVVTDSSQVVDAILHYNVHTEDAGLLKSAFPEHRDLASHTLYMRRSCVDGLRAQCRRLRAAYPLERDWKVGPTIYLLTPGEWDLDPDDGTLADDRSRAIETLNRQRLLSLPEAVRIQFRLGPQSADVKGAPRSDAEQRQQDIG